MFSARIVPNVLLKGRVNHFLKAREILTKDPEILEIAKRFKIPFLKNPTQDRVPQTPQMGQEQAAPLQAEIENILKKGAIQQTEHQPWEFLSQWRKLSVMNLRYLNQFISYQLFIMEGLFCLHELLQEENYMCKLDMKDAYFSVPLHQSSRNYVRFS